VFQKRKATIKITAAHSNAMPPSVECNHRCNDKVESSWRNCDIALRFPEIVPIFSQLRLWRQLAKLHRSAITDDWGENLFTGAPRSLNDKAGFYLIRRGQIAGDAPAGCELVHSRDSLRNYCR
jgi:hypothetical protein